MSKSQVAVQVIKTLIGMRVGVTLSEFRFIFSWKRPLRLLSLT